MDRHSEEYLELAEQRRLLANLGERDYKDYKWVEEFIQKIDKHGFTYCQDFYDLDEVKEIGKGLEKKYCKKSDAETAENHTTTHYIWHTQEDSKVRSSHATNVGKVFAWDNPPTTGNPGEDYGCRCWAEACYSDDDRQKDSDQVVTFAASDSPYAWKRDDFFYHYNHGNGVTVRLSEIGRLQDIINHAKTYDQGGGSIFKRVDNDIFKQARQNSTGSFSYSFTNSYEFEPVVFEIGGATVEGAGTVDVIDCGEFWQISADIDYAFQDEFIHPYDVYDTGIWPLTIDTGNPYYIKDEWSTHLETLIRK